MFDEDGPLPAGYGEDGRQPTPFNTEYIPAPQPGHPVAAGPAVSPATYPGQATGFQSQFQGAPSNDGGTWGPNFSATHVGPQTSNWGATMVPSMIPVGPVFNGQGGYKYQRYADNSIVIVNSGTRVPVGTPAWVAIDAEMSGRPRPAGAAQTAAAQASKAGPTVPSGKVDINTLLNSLSAAATALTPHVANTPAALATTPTYQPSAVAAPPAAAAGTSPLVWVAGGLAVVGAIGAVAWVLTSPKKKASKEKA